jgi:tRNA (uracil-5-)-methyltransferase TRM9
MDFENDHVHKVYDLIADDFSKTRFNVWPSVKEFLDKIPKNTSSSPENCLENTSSARVDCLEGSSVLEVGSGNGKNLIYLKDVKNKIGCDMSDRFVEMVISKGIACVKANAVELPFPPNHFDYVLSVAVIHHLSTTERRLKAIEELFRVTKPGGLVYIQVWAFEQNLGKKDKPGRKLNFETQDTMVSWNNTHDRYYHVFVEGELENLIYLFETTVNILETKYDYGNWTAICQKKCF